MLFDKKKVIECNAVFVLQYLYYKICITRFVLQDLYNNIYHLNIVIFTTKLIMIYI